MYPQRLVTLYYQYRSGKLGKEEFLRRFEALMSRPCTREDIRHLDSMVTARRMYFQSQGYNR